MAGPYNSEPSPLYPGLCSQEHIQETQHSGLGEAWGGEHRLLNPWCPGALCVLQSLLREALQALSNYLEGRLLPVLTYNWLLLQDWVPPQWPPHHRLTER